MCTGTFTWPIHTDTEFLPVSLSTSFTYFLRQGLELNLECTISARLAKKQLESSCLHPVLWCTFPWLLMLAQQSLPTEPFLKPLHLIL